MLLKVDFILSRTILCLANEFPGGVAYLRHPIFQTTVLFEEGEEFGRRSVIGQLHGVHPFVLTNHKRSK